MTRAEKAARRDAVREQYASGLLVKEIAERFGITEAYVCTICKDIPRERSHKGFIDVLRSNSVEVIALIKNDVPQREIAERFGVSRHTVQNFTKEQGLLKEPTKINAEEAARRISIKSSGRLQYVSGYTIKEKPVRVRCVVCGGEFERTYHNITTKGGVTCPHCVERERLQLKEARDADKEHKRKEREAKAIERKAEEERKRAKRKHPCPVCGSLTDRPKYCCTACANKAANKTREHRRRERIKTQMVDKDITVEGLFRRDAGKCWLCGERCNFEDYTVRDGNFIVGDWYPSIDHVIPLVKGGEHSWANVKLAHHRCNSIKHDKII